ncbi:MAG TPA: thioredoxin domain-containing protein [Saprospiraceae bacterium]|nr:thioredoxin domain-containing protein [Saprospiraceae bacterium]HMP25833.1 thioredoxin domain-containing protein [Saprospiraceae bacterium]
MNRLQYESSPYLLQHAHNPVHWYAWKPEAFAQARRENKPILVSIGYSTCHWCHVMERESFENEDIAAFMNEHFINIKVDREERPDVDSIYMEACQVISGSGGWPLNCFLLPDGRPFFAGTYYPPKPAYNRPSWMQVLQNILQSYRDRHEVVVEQAERLMAIIKSSDSVFLGDQVTTQKEALLFSPVLLQNIYHQLQNRFDRENGGFGSAPKFPGSMALSYLLQYYHHTKEEEALRHVLFSLDRMIQGGIYDQLGGGFARYATDKAWLVPHFEKMLYDNALLVSLLSDAYCLLQTIEGFERETRLELYRETIEETLGFIEREMTTPEGGFYAALDADSEGVEGKFYVWQRAEVETILGEAADQFCDFYDVSADGNWEHTNILWRAHSFAEYAKAHSLPVAALKTRLQASRAQLFAVRAQRIRPGLDDKILLDWNALMCTAYAKAALALGRADYQAAAERNLAFLLKKFRQPDGSFHHTYKAGQTQYSAFLDDYANLIAAVLQVYQLNFNPQLLEEVHQLTEFVLARFQDTQSPLFFFTDANQQDIPLRRKELYDNATPSGNSTMIQNLLQAGLLLGQPDYKEKAVRMLKAMRDAVERYPSSFARWASGLTALVYPVHEIAIVGEKSSELAKELTRLYLPNKVIMSAAEANERYPLLAGRNANSVTNIYICRDYTCQMPVQSVEDARKILDID